MWMGCVRLNIKFHYAPIKITPNKPREPTEWEFFKYYVFGEKTEGLEDWFNDLKNYRDLCDKDAFKLKEGGNNDGCN